MFQSHCFLEKSGKREAGDRKPTAAALSGIGMLRRLAGVF
jgi:hypothetical protein